MQGKYSYSKKVTKKKIDYQNGLYFLHTEQEAKTIIAPGDTNLSGKQSYYKEKQVFTQGPTKKIKYFSINKSQAISIATGLIPFVEHDDANRALMGSNMQRQAIPLKSKEPSLIETGIEKSVCKASQISILSKKSGAIIHASSTKVTQRTLEKTWELKNNFSINKKIKLNLAKRTKKGFLKQTSYKETTYKIAKSRKSNQNTLIKQATTINKKEWIKNNQVIADGPGIKLNKLSLGKNILVGYMPWKGYNFEDAIIINKRLVEQKILNSINIKKQKTFLLKNKNEGVCIRTLT